MSPRNIKLAVDSLKGIEEAVMAERTFADASAERIQCVVLLACTEEITRFLSNLDHGEGGKP